MADGRGFLRGGLAVLLLVVVAKLLLHLATASRYAMSEKTGVPVDKYKESKKTGGQQWRTWIDRRGSPDEAALQLREMGIPGIRYLDASSRGAGQGTHNYVVFDDALIEILKRNGVPMEGLLE